MFKNRKTKKGKADEVLEYEGATSLESNPVEDYDDREDSKDQDSPTAGRHGNPGPMSLREIDDAGYNIPFRQSRTTLIRPSRK